MATEFTPLQKNAIAWTKRDVCVVAGPGSGKTTVLVERFARLVESHSFHLHEILAITFTEKAAANMKAKIAKAFEHDPARQAEIDNAWVSTIHGFCTRLLKENAIAAGLDPAFSVLDQYEAEDLQRECMAEALDAMLDERRDGARGMMEALFRADIAWHLIAVWDAIRSAGMEISTVRKMPSPVAPVAIEQIVWTLRAAIQWTPRTPVQREEHRALREWLERIESGVPEAVFSHKINFSRVPADEKPRLYELREDIIPAFRETSLNAEIAPHRALIFDILERFIQTYTRRKVNQARLDFADLESHAIRLLTANPVLRDKIRKRFRQIMLDEYQDINEQQQTLVDLIRAGDVFFGVGDVNQSIYGFRHAKPGIFLKYGQAVLSSGKQYSPLNDNFRSRPEILRCVEDVLAAAPGIETNPLTARSEFPPKAEPSIEIIKITASDKDDGADWEAGWIAHRILELRNEQNFDFRDFGIMCRTGEAMEPILRAFEAREIPYVCGRRESYLLSRDGKDITAFVALLANARDEIALATILRSPLVGIDDETLLALRLAANTVSGALQLLNELGPAQLDPAESRKLRAFLARLASWRSDIGVVPLDLLIARAFPRRSQDVEDFLNLARTRGEGLTPLQFLRVIEQLRDARATSEIELSDEEQGNRVQIMTAHAAKGLEFTVAIVAVMNRGPRTETSPVNFTREHGLGLKWRSPEPADKGVKDSWNRVNGDRIKEREKEEENRLLYVAMTRAKQHLILSWSLTAQRSDTWAAKITGCYQLRDTAPGVSFVTAAGGYSVRVLSAAEPAPEEKPGQFASGREILELPPPASSDQSDSTVTVTALSLFAHDPERWRRERYLGLAAAGRGRFDPEALPSEKESASEFGSRLHESLAGKGGPFSEEVVALTETFNASGLGQRAAASPHVEREWEFVKDIEGTVVRGSIDLWFEENGEAVIVDYKTDHIPPGGVPERAARYAAQIALYALAVDRPVRAGYLHFLRPNVIFEVAVDAAALEDARSLVRRLRTVQTLQWESDEHGHLISGY